MSELNQAKAEAAKEEGQLRVLLSSASFNDQIQTLIDELAATGKEFTSTDLRVLAAERDLPFPSHPNAWGAAMSKAARRKAIRPTGRYVKSPFVSCHSAVVAVWVGGEA